MTVASPCVGDSALVLKPGLRAAYRFNAGSLPRTTIIKAQTGVEPAYFSLFGLS